jgi:hypothetical protein
VKLDHWNYVKYWSFTLWNIVDVIQRSCFKADGIRPLSCRVVSVTSLCWWMNWVPKWGPYQKPALTIGSCAYIYIIYVCYIYILYYILYILYYTYILYILYILYIYYIYIGFDWFETTSIPVYWCIAFCDSQLYRSSTNQYLCHLCIVC